MAKFRKKPIVIEAVQWFPTEKNLDSPDILYTDGETYARIETLEGEMTVSPGDWIITGIKGEKYPCKPDIFEQTYEAVEEAADGGTA